jgi:Pyruvate/2-oxoacid:ferredoxin oxidoreductase delta subunit
MKLKFDFKNIERQIMKQIKEQKNELECPKCKVYCWDYSLKELEEMWEIYCDNCDTLIHITLSNH